MSHWQAYGEVPPLNDVVVESNEVWPGLMVEGFTLTTGDVRGGLTITVTGAEVTEAGEPELSFTWNWNDHVPIVVSVPVGVDSAESQAEGPMNLL